MALSPAGFGGREGLTLDEAAGWLSEGTGAERLSEGTGAERMSEGTGAEGAGLAVGTGGVWMVRTGELAAEIPAGVRRVHLWLHAGEAAGHEFHAGVGGSFLRAVRLIGRARAAGVAVAVSTLLTRSNARVLAGLPGWLQAHGVEAWRIAVPEVRGALRRVAGPVQVAGVGALDGLLPRLSVALPPALQALALGRRLGLQVAIAGAPLCLLGPFAGIGMVARGRSFAPVCAECPARARCEGVDAGYLRRFAGDELSPRGLRAPEGAPAPAWMFSGPGVLRQVLSDMSQETEARVVRLPVLAGGGGG